MQPHVRPEIYMLEHPDKVTEVAWVTRNTVKLIRVSPRCWHHKLFEEPLESLANERILVGHIRKIGEVDFDLKFNLFVVEEGRVNCK